MTSIEGRLREGDGAGEEREPFTFVFLVAQGGRPLAERVRERPVTRAALEFYCKPPFYSAAASKGWPG